MSHNRKQPAAVPRDTEQLKAKPSVAVSRTADASTQTETAEREYISLKALSLIQTDSTQFPQFLYHQHTIIQLVLVFIGLFVAAFYYMEPQGPTSILTNAHMGVIASMLTIVVYCVIYLPNSVMHRPHPSLWRFLQALGMCWLCAVVFALFFHREDLQRFLKDFVDPTLGQPKHEKNFSEDCNLYTPENPSGPFANLTDKLDTFFVAHFVGWLVKMFICRDFWLCMIQSILFEFIEISLRHWLPNFFECWWDSVILDLLLCNTGGIIVGWWLMKKFQMKEYKWSLASEKDSKKSYIQNLKELIITPNLERHQWKVFSSSFRFSAVVYFIIFMNLVDLSFFFNKYVLWLQPTHPILTFRTFMIGFLSIPASREYYEYISNPLQKRLGPVCWLAQAIVFAEFLIFFKNQNGQFTEPFPDYVIYIWTAIIGVTVAIFLGLLVRDIKRGLSKKQYKKIEETEKDVQQ